MAGGYYLGFVESGGIDNLSNQMGPVYIRLGPVSNEIVLYN